MEVCGRIRNINHKDRTFEIAGKDKVDFFYLTRSQIKKFSGYLQEGLFVHFLCKEQAVIHGDKKAREVISFIKMVQTSRRENIVFFDMNMVRKAAAKILNREGNKMYLDMEFTMPPKEFSKNSFFIHEIIRYGIVIENSDGVIIDQSCSLVKPMYQSGLNDRTFNFIGVEEKEMKNAISYKKFYKLLASYIELYNPTIYVWGKNDMLVLESSYKLHKLTPATTKMQFVNLMQLLKNYLGQRTDIGLFNALTYFDKEVGFEQDHNPLTDALVTREVFHAFKNYVNEKQRG